MESILKIVKELQSDSSKIGKEAILKREIDNDNFKLFIKYVLDPLQVYGIQDKKLKKYLGKTSESTQFNHLFEVFEYLKLNNTGRDMDVKLVAAFIDDSTSLHSEELKELCIQAVTKKLRLGIDKTVNKAWGKGFLNEFNVMLAKNYYDESHKVEGKEFLLTEKLDGMRSVAIHQDGKVKFFSRSGQSILGLNEIESEILMLPEGVYDGELLIKNEEQHKDRDVLQETLKISRKDGVKTGLNFWLFDSLPSDEFQYGKSKKRYADRRLDLNYLFDNNVTGVEENTRPQYEHVKLLPVIYAGKDTTVIPTLLLKLEEEGKEGLMLNLDVPYVAKRTDGLLKIKTMQTFDEHCIGVFEGEGKYKGKLGGINVNYKGYPLKTGSGFTDEQREFYWSNPNEIIGRLVEVQYFRESKNDKGGLSVSFPIFKGIRNDKSEVSYY